MNHHQQATPRDLILFDIDGTLIKTGGAGIIAMERAACQLFGQPVNCEGIEIAGRLDTLIMPDMLRKCGREVTRDQLRTFRAGYGRHLGIALKEQGARCQALPGVLEILSVLRANPGVALGLVTGNFSETGSMKLAACGIDPGWFIHNGWGDGDGHGAHDEERPPTRDALPCVAMTHFHKHHGRAPDPARVVVIGDTPHDVRCGQVNGCRTIAVATGKSSEDDLRQAGAGLVVRDLSDVAGVLEWMLLGK